jgi:O-antigen/teichoic acid export membrane protein
MGSAATQQRVARLTRGTLANILGQALNTVGQLAQVPILLSSWGTQTYGEWLALSAMVAYLATLDLGMQTYVVNRLNQCHALGETGEYTRVLHTGLLVNTVIPFTGFLIALPVIFYAPLGSWLQLRATDHDTAAWVTALLSLQVVYSIGYGMIFGIYRTIGEYARGQMVSNVRYALNLVLTICVAVAGGRLMALASTQLALIVVTTVAIYIDIRRRHPSIRIGLSQADWRLGWQFLLPSLTFLAIQLVSALLIHGSTVLVSAMFGAAALVVFATLRTLTNMVKQAAATVQLALWPEFTTLDALSQVNALRTLHLLGTKIVMTVAVCASVFLLTAGDRVIEFWTRGRVQYDHDLMLAFCVLACSQSHSFCTSVLMSASNRQKTLLWYSGSAAVVGFVAGYYAAQRYGMTGFVYGMAVADIAICAFGLPMRVCRMIGESRVRFFREVTIRSTVVLVTTYAAVRLVLSLSGELGGGLARFVSAGLLTVAFGSVAAYLLSLNGRERHRLNAVVAGMLAR